MEAAALGNIAMFEGSKGKVRLCNEIKQELDRALDLDSLDDVAYSIMGSFYLALGKVSWIERQLASVFLGSLPDGGFEEAEAALRRAIAIAPASSAIGSNWRWFSKRREKRRMQSRRSGWRQTPDDRCKRPATKERALRMALKLEENKGDRQAAWSSGRKA